MSNTRLNSESREAGSGIDDDVGVNVKAVSSVGGKMYSKDCILGRELNRTRCFDVQFKYSSKHAF